MSPERRGLSSKGIAVLSIAIIGTIILASLAIPLLIKSPLFAKPYLALVRIEGVLASSQYYTLLTPKVGVEDYIKLIDEVKGDPYARAVLIYIDSPGGTVSASEALYFKMRELCKYKVVVAYVAGYCTSGAYMAVLPVKKIIASNSSIIGSIGVYAVLINAKNLLSKVGIEVRTFKSGRFKDIGSPFRGITADEEKIYEGLINRLFELFKERVLKYRHSLSNCSEIFEGRPYTAEEAKKIGLIDYIGSLSYAINLTRNLAGLPPDTSVKTFKPARKSLLSAILGSCGGLSGYLPSIEILAIWPLPIPLPSDNHIVLDRLQRT